MLDAQLISIGPLIVHDRADVQDDQDVASLAGGGSHKFARFDHAPDRLDQGNTSPFQYYSNTVSASASEVLQHMQEED